MAAGLFGVFSWRRVNLSGHELSSYVGGIKKMVKV